MTQPAPQATGGYVPRIDEALRHCRRLTPGQLAARLGLEPGDMPHLLESAWFQERYCVRGSHAVRTVIERKERGES